MMALVGVARDEVSTLEHATLKVLKYRVFL